MEYWITPAVMEYWITPAVMEYLIKFTQKLFTPAVMEYWITPAFMEYWIINTPAVLDTSTILNTLAAFTKKIFNPRPLPLPLLQIFQILYKIF